MPSLNRAPNQTESTSSPIDPSSKLRNRLAILLVTLSLAGCKQDAECGDETGESASDQTGQAQKKSLETSTSETGKILKPLLTEKEKEGRYGVRRKIEEICQEYAYPGCDPHAADIKGETSWYAQCFVPKSIKNYNDSKLLCEAFNLLLISGDRYVPSLCNPYSLNADPNLYQLMRARFISQNIEMSMAKEATYISGQQKNIQRFEQEGDSAFGSLQEDFMEVKQKCAKWNADPQHELLPNVCLLATDKKGFEY